MKKYLFLLLPLSAFSQVSFPNNATSGAERVSNFTVSDAGNDRLEIANGTQIGGQFIPTLWSYRESSNSFSMVFTSAISSMMDNGASPVMLFTTGVPTQIIPGAPATGDFFWGPSGTTNAVMNRPLFQWRNASSKLMTILANGNIGINTESPSAILHTDGQVRFQNLLNTNTPPAFILGTDTAGNVYEYEMPAGTGGTDYDWLATDGSFPGSVNDNIYTNGSVGFNVQNPLATIHANGPIIFEGLPNSTNPVFLLGVDSFGNVARYPVPEGGVDGDSDYDWLASDGSFADSIDDNIYTNGFVGFNVQNPVAVIHSNGSVKFEALPNGTDAVFMLGTDAEGNVLEFPVPTGEVSSGDADWFTLNGSSPESIDDNIYTNGKVGINVTELPVMVGDEDVSFYNLFVSGGILTEEVRVALVDEWADYVFKEDYKLTDLKDVEGYIKENGHLKNIPSEEEVKQNGVELAEMNKLLLEKVEELTLYVIDLNKKLEQQQEEIKKLKEEK
ncbi:hypothetical protein [Flavobacterium alkalisoli]|uniref:hypothetical protein n=1 Tax=Flavobacterium alkalisoli TaxID=2602769 RepID=UPI003A8F751B